MNKNSAACIFSILCILLFLPFPVYSSVDQETAKIRKAAYKGSWYPGSKTELERTIQDYFKSTKAGKSLGDVIALIAPHAGYRYSGQCAAHAYATIMGKDYDRVFLLAFSHHYPIRGVAVSEYDGYETPLGLVKVDRETCNALLKKNLFTVHKEAEDREHSIEIQIPFLQTVLKDFRIVPLMVGSLASDDDYRAVADSLRKVSDEKTLFIVSSDMTHYGPNYGYVPFRENVKKNLKTLDSGAIEKILNKDSDGFKEYCLTTDITICGTRPIALLLHLLDNNAKGTLINYATSGEILNDFTNSVSYAAIAFSATPSAPASRTKENPASPKTDDDLTQEEKTRLLKIARTTIVHQLTGKGSIDTLMKSISLTERMKETRGVFVTIKKHGDLRGCIGYIHGVVPLYQAVIDNAISAATRDPRFDPMTASEIDEVKLEISVMTPLTKISRIEEIKVGVHGLYIEYGKRRGILLPQVATENGWNRDQFLDAVCRKAGLPVDTWKIANPTIWIYSAQVFGEE